MGMGLVHDVVPVKFFSTAWSRKPKRDHQQHQRHPSDRLNTLHTPSTHTSTLFSSPHSRKRGFCESAPQQQRGRPFPGAILDSVVSPDGVRRIRRAPNKRPQRQRCVIVFARGRRAARRDRCSDVRISADGARGWARRFPRPAAGSRGLVHSADDLRRRLSGVVRVDESITPCSQ